MTGLELASTIAWVWGILFGFAGALLGASAISRNGILSGQAAFHLGLAVIALLLCYAAPGLRRRRSAAGWIVLAVAALAVVLAIAVPAPLLLAHTALSVAIAAVTMKNWRQFG